MNILTIVAIVWLSLIIGFIAGWIVRNGLGDRHAGVIPTPQQRKPTHLGTM